MRADEQAALTVKLADFEGPLDLLLHLIRINQMDIYDIPIAEITQQYLEKLTQMQELKLDIAGDYLVMAATLMTIKSRLLLPNEPVEPAPEEEADEADPREDLVQQLLEYQAYQTAAGQLRDKAQARQQHFTRAAMAVPADIPAQKVAPGITLADLQTAFDQLVKKRRLAKPITRTIRPEQFNIEAGMERITRKLSSSPEGCTFQALFADSVTEDALVTTFMAMLELTKQQRVKLSQTQNLGQIQLSLKEPIHDEPATN